MQGFLSYPISFKPIGRLYRRLVPGSHLIAITWGWIIPFFLMAVAYDGLRDQKSYTPFWVAFGITFTLGTLSTVVELATGLWRRSPGWLRFLLLGGLYFINIYAIVDITVYLDQIGKVAYFGGDACGSFGMLYWPSVIMYFLIGLPIVAIRSLYRRYWVSRPKRQA